jgi:hypothetical protein
MKLAPIQSINQLKAKAKKNKDYVSLVILAAERMGGEGKVSFEDSMVILESLLTYGDESSIIEEVNSYIDDLGGTPD